MLINPCSTNNKNNNNNNNNKNDNDNNNNKGNSMVTHITFGETLPRSLISNYFVTGKLIFVTKKKTC